MDYVKRHIFVTFLHSYLYIKLLLNLKHISSFFQNKMFLASASEEIRLWKFSDNSQSVVLDTSFNPHHEPLSQLAWSGRNDIIASTSKSGRSIFLSSFNAQEVTHVRLNPQEPPETCLAFNSSARYLLTGSSNGKVAIYDVKKQKLKRHYTPASPDNSTTCVSFTPNDLCCVSGHQGGDIVLINVASGQIFSPMSFRNSNCNLAMALGGTVQTLQFSRFSKTLLASAHAFGTVALWNTAQRQVTHILDKGHKGPCMDLAFSPVNEMLLVSAGLDRFVRCFDVMQASCVRSLEVSHPLLSVSLGRDGHSLAAGTSNGKVLLYDLRVMDAPYHVLDAHCGALTSLRFDNEPAMFSLSNRSDGSSSIATMDSVAPSRKPLAESTNLETAKPAGACGVSVDSKSSESPYRDDSSINIYSVISPLASVASNPSVSLSNLTLPPILEDSLHSSSPPCETKTSKAVHFSEVVVEGLEDGAPITKHPDDTSADFARLELSTDTPGVSAPTPAPEEVGDLRRLAAELRKDMKEMRREVNSQFFELLGKVIWQLCITEQRIMNEVRQQFSDRAAMEEELVRLRKENEKLKLNF